MRQKGSVLVVVLGLLAILAVIGVAFLTMSSLERSTATSFALQAQMMLAADGALDYAIHQMVIDVWEWNIPEANKFEFTGRLLTGRIASGDPATSYSAACEAYDYPTADPYLSGPPPLPPAGDHWLSSPIVSNATPTWISLTPRITTAAAQTKFGIKLGTAATRSTTATWPDNLGFPVATADRKYNGLWIPDLAAPCDQYFIRASVTILDHNALVNLNAHGSIKDTTTWEYSDCVGQGYFVSDVVPPVTDLNALLFGKDSGAVPGCWGSDGPGNPKAGAVLIENPAAGNDVPYTLDEEFELRNLWGTHFKSRLEYFWDGLDATPDNPDLSMRRLKATTVSWTAAVRGDGNAGSHATMKNAAGVDQGWSAAKADLNTASADAIYEALRDSKAWTDDDELKQLVANIVTFRRKDVANFTAVSVGGANFYGAQRQPIFTEATCSGPTIDETDPNNIKRTYTVKVEVYNPWPGDWDGALDGLNTAGLAVNFQMNAGHSASPATVSLPASMGEFGCFVADFTAVVCTNNKTLKDAVQDIRLYKDSLILDKISGSDLNTLESGRIYRKAWRDTETRGSRDNSPIHVLYVGDWQTGGTANIGTFTLESSAAGTSGIPIRFPNCVPLATSTGLPVRAPTNSPFKAFARVGDLNQVLRFTPGGDPWIVTVSKTSRTNESNVKFDWMKNIDNLNAPGGGIAAAYAANVLSAGGPWNDGLDNDGDGKPDFDDTGKPGAGQTGGPEFRVAGLINLNTAISETLNALGISEPAKPIKSPVQVITSSNTPNGIEDRDGIFTRISNIATVRSDTFSVYGTVQIVDPTTKPSSIIPDSGVIRSRRFWALVDRSPSLAYPPTDKTNFIYPRILNFQWLD